MNISAGFRVKLDLYANVRPARTREFLELGCKKMDLVIMREATEGFYPDRNMFMGLGEFMPTPDVAISMRKLTSKGCERIARQRVRTRHASWKESDRGSQSQQFPHHR